VSCSQSNVGWICALLVVGVAMQVFGVVWTAVDVYLTRRDLEARKVPPITVRNPGTQSGMFGLGQDPNTRLIQNALNTAVDDLNERLRDLATGALKLRAWTVVLIAVGMVLTLVGSLVWLFSSVSCPG
jgi:hypothetical protein